jgi:hypothetical protein
MWAGPNELDLFVPELVAGSVPAINLSVPELVTECVCRSCRVNLSVPELVTECVCRSCRVNLSVPELVAGSVPELMRSRLFALSLGDRSLGDTALWATRRRRPCATRPEAKLRKSIVFFVRTGSTSKITRRRVMLTCMQPADVPDSRKGKAQTRGRRWPRVRCNHFSHMWKEDATTTPRDYTCMFSRCFANKKQKC